MSTNEALNLSVKEAANESDSKYINEKLTEFVLKN